MAYVKKSLHFRKVRKGITDRRTDGPTDPRIEMRGRIEKVSTNNDANWLRHSETIKGRVVRTL